MRRALVTALVLGILLSGFQVARGHDHRPPRAARLRAGDEVQQGRKTHSYWAKRRPDGQCVITDAFHFTTFPRAIPYAAGTPVAVTLRKPAMPVEWVVQAWRKVGHQGQPSGAPEAIAAVAEPVRRGAETIAWRLRFVPPVVEGHLYVQVEAYWPDEDGCAPQPDLGAQTATWTFHLRAG